MKNNLIYAVLLLLGFTACRKTEVENTFYAAPEKRMQDTLDYIKTALTSAPFGWKGGLSTALRGGGFGFYCNFDVDQNVEMLSDFSTISAAAVKKSTYRVTATNTPVLLFDTYNYISLLQDPKPAIANGNAGQGLRSDVEFVYKGHHGDTLFFKGKKYEQPFLLVKATEVERKNYLEGGINSYRKSFDEAFNNYKFAFSDDGKGNVLGVEINQTDKVAKFTTIDPGGSVVSSVNSSIFYTESDVSLLKRDYVSFDGKLVRALKYLNNGIILQYTDGTSSAVKSQNIPLFKFDLAFDYNKTFKTIIAGNTIPGVITNVSIFDETSKLFTASTRTITNQYFQIKNNTTAVFFVAYYSGTPPTQSNFTAQATYEIVKRDGNKITLKRVAIDGNFNSRATQLVPVNNFFGTGEQKDFILDWVDSSDASVKFPIGAIKSATNLNNFLHGRISN